MRRRRSRISPFIFLSGTLNEEAAAATIKRGATDFLPKDKLDCLGPVIARALERGRRQEKGKPTPPTLPAAASPVLSPAAISRAWLEASFRHLGLMGAGVAAALAILTLLGWTTGWSTLARVRSVYIPMAPSSALCFLAISANLLLIKWSQRRLAWLLAAAVLGVAAAKLAEAVAGIRLGVDEWLVRHPADFGAVSTGHMSPITALNFSLLAVATLILGDSRWKKPAGPLSALVAIISLVVLVGYLYGSRCSTAARWCRWP